MALKFGPDKRKGERKRTVIDPRRGGKAGDAGPKFQREGAQPRTKITDSRISNSPNAGFSGSKKSIAPGSFKAAFAVALAKGPGTIFTFKGKKYKAIKKHEMKGPSASRVEDKSISAASSVKGRPEGKNPPLKTYTVDGKKVSALNRQEALKKAGAGAGARKKKPTNAGGQRLGQRKAGGMMKKYTKGGMNKYNKGSMLGDLDKDGVMSGYEQKRQDAITTAMGNKNMSGGMAKKKMMGGGMMQYSKGTGKKGVTVQARGCGLARKKPTKIS